MSIIDGQCDEFFREFRVKVKRGTSFSVSTKSRGMKVDFTEFLFSKFQKSRELNDH